ncbi:MAG: CHAT domain-containing protein [bacterium]|nr:CHAT domain-containing protein [bacterium]
MDQKKTILILLLNSRNTSRLRLDEEARRIQESLKHSDKFIIELAWVTRIRDLRREILVHEPTIVHFCGYGEEEGLIVEDEFGEAIVINPGVLANLFELFKDRVEQVRCVLLSACYSEEQARALTKHVEYVIGMNKAISDKATIKFDVGFYDALGAGSSIEEAFQSGCSNIPHNIFLGYLIPFILKRSDQERTAITKEEPVESWKGSKEALPEKDEQERSPISLGITEEEPVESRREEESESFSKGSPLSYEPPISEKSTEDGPVETVNQKIKRTLNTWLIAGDSVEHGRILPPSERLEFKKPYLLHVDIGPRNSDTPSIVINPVEIKDILEKLYDRDDQEGVTLEVAIFSNDFWVGPARLDPPVDHLVWQQPPAEQLNVKTFWQPPTDTATLTYLWLSRTRPSHPIHFSLQARRPGLCYLRLCVYYQNNLLQSLLLKTRVVRIGVEQELTQLDGIGANRMRRLSSIGIQKLSDLTTASPDNIANVTGMNLSRARRWIETAKTLKTLGNRARIEYTTTADFTQLQSAIPSRTVSLVTNQIAGTHVVSVKVGQWDEESKTGDDVVYPQFIPEKQLEEMLKVIRNDWRIMSSSFNANYEPVRYLLSQNNKGTAIYLARALYRLAAHGRLLYTEFFKEQKIQDELAKRLQDEKQALHIGRVAGNCVIPWSAIYDQPLTYEDLTKPKYVCLLPLKQISEGHYQSCAESIRAYTSQITPDCQRKKAISRTEDPREKKNSLAYGDVDVYFYEDCDVCLRKIHNPKQVVCPSGFWGFTHYLEQPPQQLQDDTVSPRDLKQRVEIERKPVLNVNVSTTLDMVEDHLNELKKLTWGSKSVAVLEAGKDILGPTGDIMTSGRESVIEALQNKELSLIYFYCHGGAMGDPLEAFIAVGSSIEQQIRAVTLDNEGYDWENAPLVFINGCKTVALEPGLFGNFIHKFADRGAAGVIGTEVSVWEPLAKEVAEMFFRQFLEGHKSVGEILLDIRRHLLQKRNPLGLIYTNYCSIDLKIRSQD